MSWKVVTVGVLLALAFSATAAAEPPSDSPDPTYDCGYLGENGCRESDQAREPGPSAVSCRIDVEAVFWTGTDWERLAKAMGNDRTPCGEYWVSIPPLAANKKGLRVLQDDVVRSYGVHPIAEFSVGEVTGWANWVLDPGKNRTWFQAGVEFRRAMAAAGYRGPNETWLLNELDRTTMRDGPREAPDHIWPAFRRADMVQLLSGLYYGDIGMDPLPGVVEIGILPAPEPAGGRGGAVQGRREGVDRRQRVLVRDLAERAVARSRDISGRPELGRPRLVAGREAPCPRGVRVPPARAGAERSE
jgi:hypothetical protein